MKQCDLPNTTAVIITDDYLETWSLKLQADLSEVCQLLYPDPVRGILQYLPLVGRTFTPSPCHLSQGEGVWIPVVRWALKVSSLRRHLKYAPACCPQPIISYTSAILLALALIITVLFIVAVRALLIRYVPEKERIKACHRQRKVVSHRHKQSKAYTSSSEEESSEEESSEESSSEESSSTSSSSSWQTTQHLHIQEIIIF
ncbi:hypothetical protein Hamer_G016127 [Homarus americanus]|uniref:Uncharacterized protein n=1 Tax=Homarus americanus TaxID=6706 RepID=A0A8J5KM83_HOMAM|nr:hypothetical protein Hamer_G016127 [Homarus americanus]